VAVSGGVGGAKLALGLYRVLAPRRLTVIVNTGDDFEHLGLHVSPDLDTMLYTLADVANADTGWGRSGETWRFMRALEALGGETWFALGDQDLAVHVERTHRLRAGESLGAITTAFAERLGVRARLVPASDDPVRTWIRSGAAVYEFQHWFVRERCQPTVTAIEFRGAETARAHPDALAALADPHLQAVVICPSNPLISIEPVLALSEIRRALARTAAPVIAVSPIVGGEAVKGPTAQMLRDLGLDVSADAVGRRYGTLLRGYVLDRRDARCAARVPVETMITRTLMNNMAEKEALARAVLAFAARLRGDA
jgi:LPPG:FO 2-phospho-L-lactate transferase